MIQKSNFIDIAKTNALTHYYLIRNKENKFFFLIMNEIYDTSIKFFEILLLMKRDNRISIDKSCSCDSAIKYKKSYKFYTLKLAQINNFNVFTFEKC